MVGDDDDVLLKFFVRLFGGQWPSQARAVKTQKKKKKKKTAGFFFL